MNSEHSGDETIRLDQFLKLCQVVATGGQAKVLIQGGEVLVNGEQETRRRRQLVAGDKVQFDGEQYEVVVDDP
ncbi:MAG: RNA-binding S4 domain-containing protein [Pirellulaceae bacterium]|jgi:ribosome-associated protein